MIKRAMSAYRDGEITKEELFVMFARGIAESNELADSIPESELNEFRTWLSDDVLAHESSVIAGVGELFSSKERGELTSWLREGGRV